ncbi:MAG TPA: metal ABC transporter permease, partial [bacterium]|nr:metal ABC transporter permease [bacterium]
MEYTFFENFHIWRDAVAVLVISGIALSFAGVWISFKKAVFLPLVISSFSSLGVVVSFLVADLFEINSSPYIFSLIFAIAISFYFANQKFGALKGPVAVYLISTSLIFIAGSFIRADIHDIDSILFGSAVLAEVKDVALAFAGAALMFTIFALFYKKFLFVSFDPESAPAFGIRSYVYDVLMYAAFAVVISISSRAAGAFPVFGLTIFPALTGLNLGKNMISVFIISAIAATVSAFLGYYISFVFELPTGASVVA